MIMCVLLCYPVSIYMSKLNRGTKVRQNRSVGQFMGLVLLIFLP